MTSPKPTHHYLRFDPARTDYTVTEAELEILERGNSPLWKDVVLVSVPLAASTLFNAYGEGKSQTGELLQFTLPIFVNSIIGVVSVGFAILSSVAWFKSKTSFRSVIERIKNKPLYPVPPGTFPTKEDAEQEADPQRPNRKKQKSKPVTAPSSESKGDASSQPGTEGKAESSTQEHTEGGGL